MLEPYNTVQVNGNLLRNIAFLSEFEKSNGVMSKNHVQNS